MSSENNYEPFSNCAFNFVSPNKIKLKEYVERIERGDIDLHHGLIQRPYVWDRFRQQKLIESIMMGVPIPPIIFVVNNDDEIQRTLDGQQRLVTIKKFFNNEICYEYESNHNQIKFWFSKIPEGEVNSRILSEHLKKRISNTEIAYVEYKNISEKDQAEMFVRIQLSLSLNQDHIIHAFIHIMKEKTRNSIIAIKDIFDESVDVFRNENYNTNRSPKCNKESKDTNETYFFFISYAIFKYLYKDKLRGEYKVNVKLNQFSQNKDEKIMRSDEFQSFVIKKFKVIRDKLNEFIAYCRENHYIIFSENDAINEFYYFYNGIDHNSKMTQILSQDKSTIEKWHEELKSLESSRQKYRSKVKDIYCAITNCKNRKEKNKISEFKVKSDENLSERTKDIIDFLEMMHNPS